MTETNATRFMWAISSGSYSDYRVHAVCASEADAQAVIERANASGDDYYRKSYEVERIMLVDDTVQQAEVLKLSVEVFDDGSAKEGQPRLSRDWPFAMYEDDWLPVRWRWIRAPMYNGKGGRLEVSGTDHERVRKVYSERKAWLQTEPAARSKREIVST